MAAIFFFTFVRMGDVTCFPGGVIENECWDIERDTIREMENEGGRG